MGDEWVCQDCGQASSEDPGNQSCPACGGEMINIGAVDEDLKVSKKPSDQYEDDDLEAPIDPVGDFDPDFEEEPEVIDSKKK